MKKSAKSCLRTILLALAVYLLAATAFFLFLRPVAEHHDALGPVTFGAALCVLITWMYINGIATKIKERAMLRAAVEGGLPSEGARGAFVGTIESNISLRSPLSGILAVAYSYRISRQGRSQGSTTLRVLYRGEAFVPLSIATSTGTLPLFCRPHLDVPRTPLADRERAKQSFEQYSASTTFRPPRRLGDPAPAQPDPPTLRTLHRIDEGGEEGEPSWPSDDLLEHAVLPGERVTIFGAYSPELGGIVSDVESGARIVNGDPEEVLRKLGRKISLYATLGVIFLLLSFAIVWGTRVWVEKERRESGMTATTERDVGAMPGHQVGVSRLVLRT